MNIPPKNSPGKIAIPDDGMNGKQIVGVSGPNKSLSVSPGRSMTRDQIDEDISQMKSLWSMGYSNAEVRERLSLDRSKWDVRLKRIAVEDDFDSRLLTWKKFEIKKKERYADARQIAVLAMELEDLVTDESGQVVIIRKPADPRVALQAIKLMNQIDNDIIKHGQELGIFHKEADKKEIHVKGEHVIAAMVMAEGEDTENLLKNFRALDDLASAPKIRVADLNESHPNDTYQRRFDRPEPIPEGSEAILEGELAP